MGNDDEGGSGDGGIGRNFWVEEKKISISQDNIKVNDDDIGGGDVGSNVRR